MELMPHEDKFPQMLDLFTPDIVNKFANVIQARSSYQLQHFVVNQHDTDPMRYMQTLLEIQSIYYTVKNFLLECEKIRIRIKRLKATGDELDAIQAEQEALSLEQLQVASIGTYRELKELLQILETFPEYTREEIEANQAEYWHKRMYRQIEVDKTGGNSQLGSHLNSLIQMGELKYEAPPRDATLEFRKVED